MILTLSGKLERHHCFFENNNFSKTTENVPFVKKIYLCCLFISPRAIKHCVLVIEYIEVDGDDLCSHMHYIKKYRQAITQSSLMA